MTSANAIEYRILDKNKKQIASYHENIMCKMHFDRYVIHTPHEDFSIQAYGYDEEEEYWEGEIQNLKIFLIKNRVIKE